MNRQDVLDIEKAATFAENAHRGQRRTWGLDEGLPYTVHLARVVSGVARVVRNHPRRAALIQAAWLHDTIEDTPVTWHGLKEHFGSDVADIVYALTQRPDTTYAQYINRVCLFPDTVIIKTADVKDNLRGLPPGHSLQRRYQDALKKLHAAQEKFSERGKADVEAKRDEIQRSPAISMSAVLADAVEDDDPELWLAWMRYFGVQDSEISKSDFETWREKARREALFEMDGESPEDEPEDDGPYFTHCAGCRCIFEGDTADGSMQLAFEHIADCEQHPLRQRIVDAERAETNVKRELSFSLEEIGELHRQLAGRGLTTRAVLERLPRRLLSDLDPEEESRAVAVIRDGLEAELKRSDRFAQRHTQAEAQANENAKAFSWGRVNR